MAMALRPRDRPNSIISRYGSQALDRPGEPATAPPGRPEIAVESVVTSLAGFARPPRVQGCGCGLADAIRTLSYRYIVTVQLSGLNAI